MQDSREKTNWLIRLLQRSGRAKISIIISILIGIIGIASGLLPYYAVAKILVLILNESITWNDIILWISFGAFGFFIKHVFHSISILMSHRATFEILRNIRKDIVNKLKKVPMGFIINHSSGKLKNILVDEVERLEQPLAHLIPEFISNVIAPVVIFVTLLLLDWRMAFASLVTIPIGFFCYSMMMQNYKSRYQKYSDANNKMNSVVVEYINGIEVIRTFNQSAASYKNYSDAVSSFKDYTLAWYKHNWPFSSTGSAVMPTTMLGVLPIGGILCMQGTLSIDTYVICIILSMSLAGPIIRITELIDNVSLMKQSERIIDELLKEEELKEAKEPITGCGNQFDFYDVSFAYDKKQVLNHISFSTGENKTTAFVGPSGSGKSTIVRLMARFWDVTSGKICLGGVDIRDMSLTDLMNQVSYVTQDNFLFHFSILENIRMGNPNASDIEVVRAAKKAYCHDFITKLENGYHTLAGDAGKKLSGGEKQRIAIARAILKNAPIVILDEATAFTDPENEELIQKSIAELTKGKTLIMVAHRLSTIVNADQIIVMNHGNIEAFGGHEELLNNSLLYKNMWNTYMETTNWNMKGDERQILC